MRVVSKNTLIHFYEKYNDSKIGLLFWFDKISKTNYENPQQIIKDFKGADFIGNERIVFNIARNKFRLVVSFNYEFKTCWIKFVGTHSEYDKIDAKLVNQN